MALAILCAMGGGALAGWLWPESVLGLGVLPEIFLRLIRSIIAPVLFGVLVTAVADAGGIGGLGRLGWKSLVYFEAATTIALLLGWAAVVLLEPGAGAVLPPGKPAAEVAAMGGVFEQMVPASIFDAMARGDIVQILVFCLLLGAAAGAVGAKAEPLVRFASAVTAVTFAYTRYVMWLAPPAVFAVIAGTVARSGRGGMEALGRFVAASWLAQTLFLFVVIGASVLLAGLPLRRFARAVEEPFLVAFATTSSAAALPQTLAAMERLGISTRVSGIVAPLSLSLNLTGSTIHLVMASFFVAQAAGMALPPSRQVLILLVLKLTSKGVAGLPRANFVILSSLFATFGLPAEGLALLLSIDALIDPIRTSINVLGHCAAVPVMARWEGERPA